MSALFQVIVHDDDGEHPYLFDYNIFYEGTVKGRPMVFVWSSSPQEPLLGMYKSNVRAKVLNGTFEATILTPGETYVLQHAFRHGLGYQATHVIYRQSDVVTDLPSVHPAKILDGARALTPV
jgi:hypothetical protein